MVARLPLILAAVLLVSGELEVLLGSATGDERLVSALALPAVTLPVAAGRRAPLAALLTVAIALLVQAVLGGMLVGDVATTVIAAGLVLYFAGRHVTGTWQLAGAAVGAAGIAATRIGFDPAAQDLREAVVTCVAVASPLLVGRWARSQGSLQRELSEKARRRARDRARDARHAADEERARIAADLQVAVAGGLHAIVADAEQAQAALESRDSATARERLARIAAGARAALADVRRVLGVLRREGDTARRTPAPAEPHVPAAVTADSPVTPPTEQPQGSHRRPALEEVVADRLLAGLAFAVAAIELAIAAPGGEKVLGVLTAAAVAAPLLWRRQWPLVTVAAVLAAISIQSLLLDLDSFPVGDILAMVIASGAIGIYARQREAVAGLLLAAAGAGAHAAVFYPEGIVPAVLGGVAVPWTVGRVVSSNRRLTMEERQRGIEVERSRAREAEAAVMSERMRVARELHDAVAHNISVIAIQAGGADGIVERDPERTAQVVTLIASVAREALAELSRLSDLPSAAPAPGLADLDRLASRAEAAGLSVDVRVEGEPVDLPAGVDLAAFRIVQEALTNTAKHAGADHAWVSVRQAGHAVELEIGDDGGGPRRRRSLLGGTGHGLVGMRERVALYGGSLDVGRHASGGFLVRARLPIENT